MTDELKLNTLDEACAAAWRGVVRGLASQDWQPCVSKNGLCLLSYKGLHCARGWLLVNPPEGRAVMFPEEYAPPLEAFMAEHGRSRLLEFITLLQNAHDDCDAAGLLSVIAEIGHTRGWKWPSGVEAPPWWKDPK